jgi:hypothetical protein
LLTACNTPCERELKTKVTYTGSESGTVYTRQFLPGAAAGSGSSGLVEGDDAGVLHGGGSSDGCWEQAAAQDEPGGILEGWLDMDGDDETRCGCGDAGPGPGLCKLDDRSACGPEVGDPQGRKEYTLKAKGITEVDLEFGDP